MPQAPIYSVGDTAYLRESAVIGFLEGYEIGNIEWDPQYNRWLYRVYTKHRGSEPSSVVDMHNLRNYKEVMMFGENDLVDEKEALDLAIVNTEQRLDFLKNKRARYE